jgi:type III restriction enzyme
MTIETLAAKFDAMEALGFAHVEIPADVTGNLARGIALRPYQHKAIKRFCLWYNSQIRTYPAHLAFHMATGSGKTVVMASLIVYLYRQGYRDFLFFVNTSQIIEKTKENFLNPHSSKTLFGPAIRIDDRRVRIREVASFQESMPDDINIHFTTIHGLHSRMNAARENEVTAEDLQGRRLVLLSDEAHHINAETKKKLTKQDQETRLSWESTVARIFGGHRDNILLDFTATLDLNHPAIRQKYSNKLLYDYELKRFRLDGYSKEIQLRQADLPPPQRMLQASLLSQYRRKVAASHGIILKPVILMKSRTIEESFQNEETFHTLVDSLTAQDILELEAASSHDPLMTAALHFVLKEQGMSPEDFVRECQIAFDPCRVINVNRDKDLARQQLLLNTLEDADNEVRVIFAVDKLNEGWDVLNLFDIVRLYDTRDAKSNTPGKTTMAEAQLIGRGARYWPFVAPDLQDADRSKRKYDNQPAHPLKIIEELHYHCAHNPRYIDEIRNALQRKGAMEAREAQYTTVKLKDKFIETALYQSGMLYVNQRRANDREEVGGLTDYIDTQRFQVTPIHTGNVTQKGAFGDPAPAPSPDAPTQMEETGRDIALADLSPALVRFALDCNDFFHLASLRRFLPKLTHMETFRTGEDYLGPITFSVRGAASRLDDLDPKELLPMVQDVLRQIEAGIRRGASDHIGTPAFVARPIRELFADYTIKIPTRGEGQYGFESSAIQGVSQMDLSNADWHAYEDTLGTDQEKLLVRLIHDQVDALRQRYGSFYLVRNERAFTLYDFDEGRAFEPDFVLFLCEGPNGTGAVTQVFVEPKGKHLMKHDAWKDAFLRAISTRATGTEGHQIVGLPLFNEGDRAPFDAAFQPLIEG